VKFIFNSQFLKVTPPATSFGDAWELLCLALLRANDPLVDYQHLGPPDRGIDILAGTFGNRIAYQCKADERGALGTAPLQSSVESLRTAAEHRQGLGWSEYRFATNADYSGKAVEDIVQIAEAAGIAKSRVAFLGPQHWSDLCEQHLDKVQDRLDYRLQVTEAQVIEAFRRARYYEEKVEEYRDQIAAGKYRLELKNNRTPLILSIPFSRDLTIEHCLDVAMQLLNLSLDSLAYTDIGTSARPSISITIDRIPQSFNRKISELSEDELSRLQLWITIIWKDELERREPREDTAADLAYLRRLESLQIPIAQRGPVTIERYSQRLETTIWSASASIKDNETTA
jgi:hypothetical protein